jgi:hypothetical protein
MRLRLPRWEEGPRRILRLTFRATAPFLKALLLTSRSRQWMLIVHLPTRARAPTRHDQRTNRLDAMIWPACARAFVGPWASSEQIFARPASIAIVARSRWARSMVANVNLGLTEESASTADAERESDKPAETSIATAATRLPLPFLACLIFRLAGFKAFGPYRIDRVRVFLSCRRKCAHQRCPCGEASLQNLVPKLVSDSTELSRTPWT